jgi:hypothetical protein
LRGLELDAALRNGVFLLALVGFGTKAGIITPARLPSESASGRRAAFS